jgi:beta-aspartyl-peptidase (threonine type)
VGDSPIVGSGGFADNLSGGCSSTGHGESIIPVNLCLRVALNMESGLSPNEASEKAISFMFQRTRGRGGVIAISKDGAIGRAASTQRMAWASATGFKGQPIPAAIEKGIENADGFAKYS